MSPDEHKAILRADTPAVPCGPTVRHKRSTTPSTTPDGDGQYRAMMPLPVSTARPSGNASARACRAAWRSCS